MTSYKEKSIIFWAGIIFRLFLVIYIVATNPYGIDFFNNPNYQGADQGDFVKITRNIVDYRVFSFSDGPTFESDEFRTPLFPFFMALSYWLTHSFLLYTFLNILISAVIGVIVYEIAFKIFSDKKIAFWSGLVFVLLPYGAYLSIMAMADNLFVFLFSLAIYFVINFYIGTVAKPSKLSLRGTPKQSHKKSGESVMLPNDSGGNIFVKYGNYKNLVFCGVFLGLATLTRPISQYFILFIILFLLAIKGNFKEKISRALFIFCVFVLTLSPWLIRNYVVFNKVQLSSLGGYHMFVSWVGPYRAQIKDHISRSEEADKLYQYIKDKYGKYGHEAMYDPIISAKLGEEAKSEIKNNFLSYSLFHLSSSVIYFMNNDVILTLSEVFHIKSGGLYVFEKIFNRDWSGFWSAILKLNILYFLIYFISYLLLFIKNILAVGGLIKFFKKDVLLSLFILSIIVYFPILVGPEGHARFRYPVEPFLLMFALASLKVHKVHKVKSL